MKKTLALGFGLCLILLMLTGCAGKETALEGRYEAVDPPVESGETVITTLVFNGNSVTMSADVMEQTVEYQIADNTFTIFTDYGDFDYDYTRAEDGTLMIDGVSYKPLQ